MDTSLVLGAVLLLAGLLFGVLLGIRIGRSNSTRSDVDPIAAVAEVLRPAGAALSRVEAELQRVERERVGSYAGLREQVAALHHSSAELGKETRSLARALNNPGIRGQWGELQLRRVVELAGLAEHCDFDTQVTGVGGDETAQTRPDLVIRLAGNRAIPVDAKVPLHAALAAMDELGDADSPTDLRAAEQYRRAVDTARIAHARALRSHVDALSRKAYWRQFQPSPEFVVMFVPGESLLEMAVRVDPGLVEHAFSRNVVLATPSTLYALLRTIAHSWRSERLSESAEEVHRLGRELVDRLGVFAEHLGRVGSSLQRSVDAYNGAVRSYDSRVLVSARRVSDLSAAPDRELGVEQVSVSALRSASNRENGMTAEPLVRATDRSVG